MPYPSTERGLVGHFLRSVDIPTSNQHAAPPPVLLPKYLSLQTILVAGAGRGGVRSGAGGHRIPRDGGGGGRGKGGISRYGRRIKHDMVGGERATTEATNMTVTAASGKRRTADDLLARKKTTEKGEVPHGR